MWSFLPWTQLKPEGRCGNGVGVCRRAQRCGSCVAGVWAHCERATEGTQGCQSSWGGTPPPTARKAQRFSQGLTSRCQPGLLAPGRGCSASYRGLVLSAVPASGGWGQRDGGLDPPPRSSGHPRPCALPSSRPVVPGLHPDHQLEPLHPKAVSAVRHSVRQRADHRPQQQ